MGLFNRKPKISGYCVACRAKRDMDNPEVFTMKNGRSARRAICKVCGHKFVRIGKVE